MGLGRVTLAMAREEAKRLREMIAAGKNPIAERRRVEAEKANRKTFAEVAQFVIERERNGWGAGSLASWERSLFRDAKTLAETNVDAVAVEHVKQVVTPIFDRGNHVAARRTLSRIEKCARLRHSAWLAIDGQRRRMERSKTHRAEAAERGPPSSDAPVARRAGGHRRTARQ